MRILENANGNQAAQQTPQPTAQAPQGSNQHLDPGQLAQISNIIKQIQTMISPQHQLEGENTPAGGQPGGMQAQAAFSAQQSGSGDSNQNLKSNSPEEEANQNVQQQTGTTSLSLTNQVSFKHVHQ
jgi:hypothetical protein